MVTKEKWILKSKARNYGGGYCTEMDIARDYLTVRYGGKRRRITTSQYNLFRSEKPSPPLYASPCEIENALYLDIKSAYWQIIQRVGWDVDYNRDRYMLKRSDNSDFPFPNYKLARNAMVSITRSSSIATYYPNTGGIISRKVKNNFMNDSLWFVVMDVLNGVANDMIKIGAKYVHTDGYIIDSSLLEAAQNVFDSWKLEYAIKNTGKATIYRVARYDIGEKRAGTKNNARHAMSKVYPVSYLTKQLFTGL